MLYWVYAHSQLPRAADQPATLHAIRHPEHPVPRTVFEHTLALALWFRPHPLLPARPLKPVARLIRCRCSYSSRTGGVARRLSGTAGDHSLGHAVARRLIRRKRRRRNCVEVGRSAPALSRLTALVMESNFSTRKPRVGIQQRSQAASDVKVSATAGQTAQPDSASLRDRVRAHVRSITAPWAGRNCAAAVGARRWRGLLRGGGPGRLDARILPAAAGSVGVERLSGGGGGDQTLSIN